MAYLRSDLRVLTVQGGDARAFLNGLITQRTDLPVGAGTYAALLTPQGKLLADFPLLFVADDRLALALPASEFDNVRRRLSLFKLKSDVTLCEQTAPLYSQIGASRLPYGDTRHPDISHGFELPEPGEAGSASAFHQARAALGVVEGVHDLEIGKSTLLDEGLACALDWDKGCYMGQEVTARMRYRALIKRVLVAYQGEATPGEALMDGEKKIGQIRSHYQNGGFAYVRKAFAGQQINGLSLAPFHLPWD